MKTNKKAFTDVLRFMVGLILSLLMLFFFFSCSSKIFGTLTDQGKQSFVDFTKQLKAVEQPLVSVGDLSKAILILDEETALVYFQPNKDKVIITALADSGRYNTYFNNPKTCAADKGCLCLFRKSKIEEISAVINSITATEFTCQEFDLFLQLESQGIGQPHSVNSYIYSNGFAIDRLLIGQFPAATSRIYFETPRRVVLGVEKGKTDILLKG